ncbi:MAG: hypothetical protein JNK15_03170 [Planctomycetes bacterium]|nr:hypothetical protein [Planctomycetota bacterium]
MSQTFTLPGNLDDANQAITTLTPACLESLRSSFAGTTAPTTPAPVAGQLWADTTTGYLKVRNAANSAWVPFARLSTSTLLQLAITAQASVSATLTQKFNGATPAGTVKRLLLLCETASTSSSGNEWQVQLKRYPNSAPGSPVNLISATVGTFTALGGVGGATEFVAHKVLVFTPNQNLTCADLDVLELVLTKAGTATALTNFRAFVEIE